MQLRSRLEVSGCLIGKPKCLPKLEVELNPKVLHNDSLFSLSILGECTLDLLKIYLLPQPLTEFIQNIPYCLAIILISFSKMEEIIHKEKMGEARPPQEDLIRFQNLSSHFESIS